MKASELALQLNKFVETYGDLNVGICVMSTLNTAFSKDIMFSIDVNECIIIQNGSFPSSMITEVVDLNE